MGNKGLSVFVLAAVAAGCAGSQSVTDPRGPQAAQIAGLWWSFLAVCTLVLLAVSAAVLMAVLRRDRHPLDRLPEDGEPGKVRVVAIATGITVVTLIGLLIGSVWVGSATSGTPPPERRPITVEVVGHQWWWEFRYVDAQPNRTFTTANEMRIPVGRPVVIVAKSRDVIHSFWVPNLHGKIDLVPGRTNTIWFEANQPGEFRGQCAEFCGLQHAKMAFFVIAEPQERYDAWVEAYLQPARTPATEPAKLGERVFLESQCAMCHTVRGSGAWGRVAPDLTRFASRRTIAAGTLANNRGNLAGWIINPQHIKPGTFMPPTALDAGQLHALLAYLEGLR